MELDRGMGESAVLLITIHQGKNRQIRRMPPGRPYGHTAGAHRGAWNLFSRLALWQVESLTEGRTNEAKGEREKMNDNVLHRIRNGMDGFSKGQKRIANYILTDCDKASNMTACRLGQITQVSESTVVRFASQLGYDGYPAMQKALQELVRGKLTSLQRIEASGDQINSGDIAGSVMQQDMDTLRSTIDGIDRTEFDRVVGKLVRAKRIYILGVRSSSFLAGYLNFYFHLIFENVTLVQSAAGRSLTKCCASGPGMCCWLSAFPGTLR
ncbi:MAG: hypothetical protein ACLUNQ_04595 [Oscillospiraceae bacterium]